MSTSNFTPSVLTITSTSTTGTGQGELNVVTNPSAVTDLSNWTASPSSGFASRQSSGSPLDPVVATGFQLSSSGVGQTLTSASLTVPTSLRNRKLKLEFYMTQATAAFKVDVLNSSGVRFALTTDASGVSNLPALSSSGKYTTYFDMDSGATVQVRFTSILATGTLSFTQIIVGPGIQPQGAVVGEWTTFTPTITDATGANVKSASPTSNSARWRRVGSQMEVVIIYRHSTTVGTNGTGTYRFQIPTGFTVDTSALPPGTPNHRAMVGFGQANTAGGAGDAQLLEVWTETASTTNYVSAYAYPVGTLTGFTIDGTSFGFGSTFREISLNFAVPIAEWAGSGTVQLAQNDVEYASNDGSGGAVAGAVYSTGMKYGPAGSNVVAVNSTTGGYSSTKYLVRFQTPIQPSDKLEIEIQVSSAASWLPVTTAPFQPHILAAGRRFGMELETGPDTSSVYVNFGNSGAYTNNTAYDANGSPWSGETGNKWRVRKSSAGAAVGFGLYQPGVSAGLVSSSGLAGRADGNVVPSGFVGEVVTYQTVTATLASSTGTRGLASFSIPSAGIWKIEVTAWINASGDPGGSALTLSTTSATSAVFSQLLNGATASEYTDKSCYLIGGIASRVGQNISCVAGFSGATPVYINFYSNNAISATSGNVKITALATRIA